MRIFRTAVWRMPGSSSVGVSFISRSERCYSFSVNDLFGIAAAGCCAILPARRGSRMNFRLMPTRREGPAGPVRKQERPNFRLRLTRGRPPIGSKPGFSACARADKPQGTHDLFPVEPDDRPDRPDRRSSARPEVSIPRHRRIAPVFATCAHSLPRRSGYFTPDSTAARLQP